MPLYRGHALDDWGDSTPGFLQLSKGAFVTVFGVEGKYFDAEVRLLFLLSFISFMFVLFLLKSQSDHYLFPEMGVELCADDE